MRRRDSRLCEMLRCMKQPIFVRPLTDAERETVEAGLRSSDAFTMRRCQIISASAHGEWVPRIARMLGCNEQTVRNAITAFNQRGLASLQPRSRRAQTIHRAIEAEQAERLRAMLHRSPRTFGKPTSVWTLPLAAEVSLAQGITTRLVTGETIRATLKRLDIRWQRAKHWITSPDPAYAAKKGDATD
jgi:transposase